MSKPLSTSSSDTAKSGFRALKFAVRCALFVLLFVLVAELFFRFVIPARELAFTTQDPQFMVLHYDRDAAASGLATSGRFAQQRSRWHVNNYGWNSAVDYRPASERDKPAAVIIGDSYIDGFYVNWRDHVASRLQAVSGDRLEVYSLGVSGSSLAQQINVARYAKHYLSPDIYIFMITSNDVEESLAAKSNNPYRLRLEVQKGEITEIAPRTYTPSRIRRLARYSALVRYLTLNANFSPGRRAPPAEPEAESGSETPLQPVVSYIFQRLREELPDATLVFMTDGNRKALYEMFPERPPSIDDQAYVEQAAAEVGAYSLNLNDAFFENYRAHGERLNYVHDFHWNPRANAVAADALYELLSAESRSGRVPLELPRP